MPQRDGNGKKALVACPVLCTRHATRGGLDCAGFPTSTGWRAPVLAGGAPLDMERDTVGGRVWVPPTDDLRGIPAALRAAEAPHPAGYHAARHIGGFAASGGPCTRCACGTSDTRVARGSAQGRTCPTSQRSLSRSRPIERVTSHPRSPQLVRRHRRRDRQRRQLLGNHSQLLQILFVEGR